MKKFLNVLFNVFWVLLVGLVSAISNGLLGVACCVTIIGIPLGLQYFKFVKLVFAPAGKIVVTKYSRHPVMNTFWIVFGGFLAVIIYFVIALLLCVSVVGIPLAKQLFKIVKFICAPFGSEILKDGEYSKEQSLAYDRGVLYRHICANPDASLIVDGQVQTAGEYVRLRQETYREYLQKRQSLNAFLVKRLLPVLALLVVSVGVFFIAPLLQVRPVPARMLLGGVEGILIVSAICAFISFIAMLITKRKHKGEKRFKKIFAKIYAVLACLSRVVLWLFVFGNGDSQHDMCNFMSGVIALPVIIVLLYKAIRNRPIEKTSFVAYAILLVMCIAFGKMRFPYEIIALAVVVLLLVAIKHKWENKKQKKFFTEHLKNLFVIYPNGSALVKTSQAHFEKMLDKVGITL